MTVRPDSEIVRYNHWIAAFDAEPSGAKLKALSELATPLVSGNDHKLILALIERSHPDKDWTTGALRQWSIWSRTDTLVRLTGLSRRTVQRGLARIKSIRTASGLPLLAVSKFDGRPSHFQVFPAGFKDLALEAVTRPLDGIRYRPRFVLDAATEAAIARIPLDTPSPKDDDTAAAPLFAPVPPDAFETERFRSLVERFVKRVNGQRPTEDDSRRVALLWVAEGRPDPDLLLADLDVQFAALQSGCQAYVFRWLRGEVEHPREDGTKEPAHPKQHMMKFMAQPDRWLSRTKDGREHLRAQAAGDTCACCVHVPAPGKRKRGARPVDPVTARYKRDLADLAAAELRRASGAADPAEDPGDNRALPRVIWFGEPGEVPEPLADAWATVRERLVPYVGHDEVVIWFDPSTVVGVEEGRLILRADNPHYRDWIEGNHAAVLAELAFELGYGIGITIPDAQGPPRMAGGPAPPLEA